MSTIQNIATAADRPTGLGTDNKGVTYLQLDTGRLIVWDGSNWNEYFYDSQIDPLFAANQLGYVDGLYSGTSYEISTQPIMHFDAAILDGSNPANNPGDGLAVSAWGDRSGRATNYDATQTTGAAQPTYYINGDEKYVRFDGSDSLDFANTYTLPGAFNVVVVANTIADANMLLPLGMNADSQYVFFELGGTTYGITGSAVDNTYGPNYNSIQQFWATRDGSNNHNIYVQGGNSIISKTTAATRTVARLGKANNGYWHTGDIYEVIIWGSNLSTADKNTVNSYLQNKYSSLPILNDFS